MQNQSSFLDEIAKNWEKEDDQFYSDCEYSNDYVEAKIADTKNHVWPIDVHNLRESKNLVAIFEAYYRSHNQTGVIPYFDMIDAMFQSKSLPPSNLDFGSIVVFDDVELTDVLSGVEGNFGNNGWVISKRAADLIGQYNIGQFQMYSVTMKYRNQLLDNYVYLHFYNYADEYVDYATSKFFIQKGGALNVASRSVISVASLKEIEDVENIQNSMLARNDWQNLVSIHPKEIFLRKNDLDLFKFDEISTIDLYMSTRLATKIYNEKITGFELKRTTKVKMLYT